MDQNKQSEPGRTDHNKQSEPGRTDQYKQTEERSDMEPTSKNRSSWASKSKNTCSRSTERTNQTEQSEPEQPEEISDVEPTSNNRSSRASKSKNIRTSSKSSSSKAASQPVKFNTTTRATSKSQGHLNAKSGKFGYHREKKIRRDRVVTDFLGIANPAIVHIIRNAIEIYNWTQSKNGLYSKMHNTRNKIPEIVQLKEKKEFSRQLAIVLSEFGTIDYGNCELVDQIESFILSLEENRKIEEREEVSKSEEVKKDTPTNKGKNKVLLKNKKDNERESEPKEKPEEASTSTHNKHKLI
ncbi:hypothetical protein C2G38_2179207 [Gigaspora rosea]|uniref:Uncharacterized protein n=1 Tax=Gigaspora rosea TaxID=44941 RepID=A0A397VFA0_9GLOM|nr:hypothetical protein C2G38_2179207 [Gigaspora rosea]